MAFRVVMMVLAIVAALAGGVWYFWDKIKPYVQPILDKLQPYIDKVMPYLKPYIDKFRAWLAPWIVKLKAWYKEMRKRLPWWLKTLQCNEEHPDKKIQMCYEDCAPKGNFERANGNIEFCSEKCPSGFTDIGVGGCAKPIKWLPVAKVADTCPEGKERIGALCYEPCKEGYKRSGFDCMKKDCPPGTRDDGATCWWHTRKGRGVGYIKE